MAMENGEISALILQLHQNQQENASKSGWNIIGSIPDAGQLHIIWTTI